MAPTLKKDEDLSDASKMILDYMMAQNRPYAVTDIITNLHGIVGKTLAIKVLAGLAEEGSLLAKTYGKSIIYVVKQTLEGPKEEGTDIVGPSDEEITKDLQEKVIALSAECKVLKDDLKEIQGKPTDIELAESLNSLKVEVTAADNMLEASIDPSYKSITVEEMKSLEQKLESLVKIYTKRTKVAQSLWSAVKENTPNAKEVEESMGLEWELINVKKW